MLQGYGQTLVEYAYRKFSFCVFLCFWVFIVSKGYWLLLVSITAIACAMPSAFAARYSGEVAQHLDAGKAYLDQRNYEDARIEFNLALHADPNCTDALNNLGVSCLREGNFKDAKSYFESALRLEPHYCPSLNNLAEIYYLQGDLDDAIILYREALPLANDRQFEIHTNLANALRDKNQFKEAIEHYKEAIREDPHFAPAYNGFAKLSLSAQSYDVAYRQALKAVQLKPDYATAYFHLGLAETARKHRLEAVKAFMLSLRYEKNPSYARETQQLIDRLGYSTVGQHELDQYQDTLKRGDVDLHGKNTMIALGDQAPKPSLASAQQLITERQWSQAEHKLETLLKMPGMEDPVLLNDLGLTLAAQKQYQKAASYYKRAIDLSRGKCFTASYNLGQIYRAQGNLADAEKEFHSAISSASEQNKMFPLAHNALGLVLKQKGDTQGAEAAYKMAISQAGTDLPVVHFNYAILLEKTERTREAVREYSNYLRLAPEGSNVKHAQARLKRLGVDS
jgi:tetratricopeptide (TPR) repeat protein